VLLASWMTLRLGLGTLPAGITLRHLIVLGVVAGVGFTMALFIAQLAFAEGRLRPDHGGRTASLTNRRA